MWHTEQMALQMLVPSMVIVLMFGVEDSPQPVPMCTLCKKFLWTKFVTDLRLTILHEKCSQLNIGKATH